MKTQIILNPKAGSGRSQRALGRLTAVLDAKGAHYEVTPTRGPRDAARLAREARQSGVECIAVIGGDGTISETVQGYMENGTVAGGPKLALVPAGTGGDFRKTFGFSDSPEDAARRILAGNTRRVDVGLAQLTPGADPVAFINILSFGISGRTDELVNRGPKWLGGKAAFFLGTVQAMATYRNAPVRLTVDGVVVLEGRIFTVAIANGQYFGGGMQIAPSADPGDGLLEIVVLGDLTFAESLALSRHIYSGSHLTQKKVLSFRGRVIEAEALRASEPVLIDCDGEQPGTLPLKASVIPAALELLV
ncbi:MAG: diacylglycerol kinase family lipid kinase [Polyangiaceae bacterium]|nr:diacylglycerol kinase family lipid kinase [Polyangiaceae bacterium]